MQKPYMIASDFDGTVCFWPNNISDRDRESSRRFRDAGNIFVIVTGRSWGTAHDVFNVTDFHDMDAYLCMSGAYFARPDGSPINVARASGRRLGEIIEYFRKNHARYLAVDVDETSYGVDIDGQVELENTVSADTAKDFSYFTSLNAGFHDLEEAYRRAEELKRFFGDVITPLQNKTAIDMPPSGIDKASGVLMAAGMFGIDRNRIYTVGDNYNDIAMVQAFHGRAIDRGACPADLAAVAEKTVTCVSDIIDEIMRSDV